MEGKHGYAVFNAEDHPFAHRVGSAQFAKRVEHQRVVRDNGFGAGLRGVFQRGRGGVERNKRFVYLFFAA